MMFLDHVGVGCNRVANALHWQPDGGGRVAFAAHNAVVIYDSEEARVLATLLGHTSRVNCVRWFSGADFGLPVHQAPSGVQAAAALLASGAADATIRLWLWQPAEAEQPWQQVGQLEGHTAPVTSLATLGSTGSAWPALLVSTAAGVGEVLLWECAGAAGGGGLPAAAALGAWRLRQRIDVGSQAQDCAALAALPADPGWLLLALGGVDSQIRLFASPTGGQFQEACRLSGHQNWVRGLAFAEMEDGRLLLASASQDKNVRLWAVVQEDQQQANGTTRGGGGSSGTAAAAPHGSLGKSALAASLLRYAPKPRIWTDRHSYAAIQEALLVGHEDWVHSVAWQPPVTQPDGTRSQPACLLSASMDRTMMLWCRDAATGLWMAEESVGEAGSNHLGYYSGVFNHDGSAILAHGFSGALHLWRRQPHEEGGGWAPAHALGGHFAPVVDAGWAVGGSCLLTVSLDQTARLNSRIEGGSWCEIARPQVHGHDFSCAAALPQAAAPGRTLYASGSEEKVVRVFEGPRAFADTLALAQGRAPPPSPAANGSTGGGWAVAPLGGMLPPLGLSNKAVYVEEEEEEEAAAEGDGEDGGLGGGEGGGIGGYNHGADLLPIAAPAVVAGPPLEEHLAQNTLWPEIHKLYGHGNEVYCMAADPLGRYLASACRAQTADAAAIWLWDTQRWMGVASLPAHTLTVTQLAFSSDGARLASASRDRSVAVFQRQPEGAEGPPFSLVGRLAKAHGRIVWALDWSPDSRLLATGSRDATVKLWSIGGCSPSGSGAADAGGSAGLLLKAPVAVLTLPDSVRSVAFAPECQPGPTYHLAVGLEDGALQLVQVRCSSAAGSSGSGGQLGVEERAVVWQSTRFTQHAAAVRRLCWRRQLCEGSSEGESEVADSTLRPVYDLASVGDDHAIRVFAVVLPPAHVV